MNLTVINGYSASEFFFMPYKKGEGGGGAGMSPMSSTGTSFSHNNGMKDKVLGLSPTRSCVTYQ